MLLNLNKTFYITEQINFHKEKNLLYQKMYTIYEKRIIFKKETISYQF